MLEHLCNTANGIKVVYDSINSHAATHFEDTPELKSAVIEALSKTVVLGKNMIFEYEFDEPVGASDLVETTAEDDIVYAKRKNRETFTRFTKSQLPQECSTITLFLEEQPDQTQKLGSAWVGLWCPPFPGSDNETDESRPFWDNHALVWGRQEIQAGTETTECPW